ncbi:MAG TPA: ATPase, T2SS/T4P/T4SS family, partial [Propionibacteriaceae bacterium]
MNAEEWEAVRTRIAALGRDPDATDIADALRWCGHVVSDASVLAVAQALHRDSVGAGPLDPLLALPGVTDVIVNGPRDVYVDTGDGLRTVPVHFGSDEDVRRLAVRLAASVGRRLDDASPFVDARMADGTRVHAILGSLADAGTCLSLRVPARSRLTLDDWVASGTCHPEVADVLRRMVAAKVAFLVSGGTGSGKTTLLGSLLALVPPGDRILVVEDSRELDPGHPHCVRLEGRV